MATTKTVKNRNLIVLEDGIIFYRQVGDQTFESIINSVKAMQLLSEDLDEVKILVDYSRAGKADLGARKAGFYAIKSVPFDKVAIYGASPYFTKLINLMARAIGKKDAIYFANTRAEALAWLHQF